MEFFDSGEPASQRARREALTRALGGDLAVGLAASAMLLRCGLPQDCSAPPVPALGPRERYRSPVRPHDERRSAARRGRR
jgi:hypothetical protein